MGLENGSKSSLGGSTIEGEILNDLAESSLDSSDSLSVVLVLFSQVSKVLSDLILRSSFSEEQSLQVTISFLVTSDSSDLRAEVGVLGCQLSLDGFYISHTQLAIILINRSDSYMGFCVWESVI